MSDHLAEALRRYEAADYARQRAGESDDQVDLLVALHEAMQADVQAELEVAEHVEYAGEQLRRIADSVEALVEVLTEERRRVAQIVCAAHPGFTHTITLSAAEPSVADDEPR